FTTHRGWAVGWILFLFIPIIETAITAFKTKNPTHFAYPVFVVAMYLSIGMLFYVWHPTWILFITIPMYYLICDAYKKTHKSKYDDFSQYNNANGTYYSPSGTDTHTRTKGSTVAAIVISIICGLTIVSVVAISCVFGFLGKGMEWMDDFVPSVINSVDYDDSGAYSIGSSEVAANRISKISVEWISGNITVEYYDGDTIKFSEPEQSNQDMALRYLVEINELKIKYCKSGLFNWKTTNNSGSKPLTIYLPKDFVAQEIDIESVSSKININNITARQLDITTVSGNVTAKGNFTVIDTGGVSGSVDVTTYSVPSKVDAETVSGDFTIRVPKDISGFTIDYDTVSGDVTGNDFYTSGGAQIEKGKQTFGDGSTKIDFESVSGDFEIKAAS
ncbi:MAG: DUF4097 domain-containing protein, partial [Eubacterium sp.]|nr:DUF4097 domain-containing protein [Eubacterium sp.]